ncbi:hypothetical protein [Nonomuraea aurantiaca]|uniref:hypothetical protein n=1 Tax=Nonomuraea aurantiaca TaxID=2878562 RepID=UPI001CD9B788|nr:hypothetical protein [Nonomuraea aurantiaca]MCA2227405.1 hypothetical protein [Nonomuraea aurantiaca]
MNPTYLGDTMTQSHPPIGAALLDQLRAALTRYVILPRAEAADAVTLWIATTHAQPALAHAPRLVIRGPEKRCGKSRLLDIVEATCHDPFITVNSSSAAIYRSISDDPPTILVDEADTIFGAKADGHEDLRGLLNAGHQRNRPAKRYDANANRVESIPTFAMAALAGIGSMPDTSRTAPSSSACAAAPLARAPPPTGTNATACPCAAWPPTWPPGSAPT